MLKDERKQLEVLDAKIRRLKDQIFALESERRKLLSGSQRIFKQLPVRVRKCFIKFEIYNDPGIMEFLEGKCTVARADGPYRAAKTPKERLMTIRGVGDIVADRVLSIVESSSHED